MASAAIRALWELQARGVVFEVIERAERAPDEHGRMRRTGQMVTQLKYAGNVADANPGLLAAIREGRDEVIAAVKAQRGQMERRERVVNTLLQPFTYRR
jgi:hypothetical protein